jgi:hypothetical protein
MSEDRANNPARVVDLTSARTNKIKFQDTEQGARLRHPALEGRRLAEERKKNEAMELGNS